MDEGGLFFVSMVIAGWRSMNSSLDAPEADLLQ